MTTKYGIKIFAPIDKPILKRPSDFILNSEFLLLTIHKQGSYSQLVNKAGDGFDVTINFPELNYRPIVWVFEQKITHDPTPVIDTNYHMLDWAYYGASYFGFNIVKIYNNKIVISYTDSFISGSSSFSLKGYYYIFKQEVRE